MKHTFDVRAPQPATPERPVGPNVVQPNCTVRCIVCKRNIKAADMLKDGCKG